MCLVVSYVRKIIIRRFGLRLAFLFTLLTLFRFLFGVIKMFGLSPED